MSQRRFAFLQVSALGAAFLLGACSKEEEVKPDLTPKVGPLELATALRIGDTPPSDSAQIEISPDELRVGGETVLALEKGKIPPADKSGYEIPKLKEKLAGKSALAITAHAVVPYATLARVMYTGQQAGASMVAFKVRKPNSTDKLGWIELKRNHFVKSADASEYSEAELVPWDKFSAAWDEALSSCQGAGPKADCGYAPMTKASGGKLDLMLRVRGSGFAIRARQAGAAEASVADAGAVAAAGSDKKDKKKRKKKGEMLDGIKAAPEAAEEAPAEPSKEHIFTLRTDQATVDPSPISGIVKPICGDVPSCPVVLDVEGINASSQVFALLGAAFPDGTPAPRVAWVLPPDKP